VEKINWTPQKLQTIRDFIQSGKTAEFIASHFGISINNLRVIMHTYGISMKTKQTGKQDTSLQKLRKGQAKDYAYRLMVLQGEAIRRPEEIKPFSDEQLLSWKDINQFCKDLLYWMGKPLKLLGYQRNMVCLIENNKYSIIVSGRQIGKDMVASAYTLWKCITIPNYFAIIVSPSQRQSDELFKRMQHFVAGGDIYYSVKESRADEFIFSNGSRILSLPSRGAITGLTHLNLALINEAGRPELPDNTIDEIMPMTIAVNGKLVLLGNPYSKTTSFYQHYQNPLFGKMHIRTIQNTEFPNLTEFLEAERRRCTKNEYLQQYEGVFADFPNAFLPSSLLDSSVKEYDYSLKKNENLKYYVGIDWGMKIDESVLVVISKAKDGTLKVEYCESWSGQSLSKCSNKLEYLDAIFKFDIICPEEAGLSLDEVGKLKEKPFGHRVKPFIPTNESQFKGYNLLLKQFEQGMITIPADEIKLINQLRYLELKETSTGKFRVDHPSGRKSDYCDAIMMAVNSACEEEEEYIPFIA